MKSLLALLTLTLTLSSCGRGGKLAVPGDLEIREPFLAAGEIRPERRTETFGPNQSVWLLLRVANYAIRGESKKSAGEIWMEQDIEVRDSSGAVLYSEAGVMRHHGRINLRGLAEEIPIQTRIEMLEERPPGVYRITAVVHDRLTDREARASLPYKVE